MQINVDVKRHSNVRTIVKNTVNRAAIGVSSECSSLLEELFLTITYDSFYLLRGGKYGVTCACAPLKEICHCKKSNNNIGLEATYVEIKRGNRCVCKHRQFSCIQLYSVYIHYNASKGLLWKQQSTPNLTCILRFHDNGRTGTLIPLCLTMQCP